MIDQQPVLYALKRYQRMKEVLDGKSIPEQVDTYNLVLHHRNEDGTGMVRDLIIANDPAELAQQLLHIDIPFDRTIKTISYQKPDTFPEFDEDVLCYFPMRKEPLNRIAHTMLSIILNTNEQKPHHEKRFNEVLHALTKSQ